MIPIISSTPYMHLSEHSLDASLPNAFLSSAVDIAQILTAPAFPSQPTISLTFVYSLIRPPIRSRGCCTADASTAAHIASRLLPLSAPCTCLEFIADHDLTALMYNA